MPKKISKRQQQVREILQQLGSGAQSIDLVIETLKKLPSAKFVESVDLSIKLGVDPKNSSQVVRGSVELPNGNGKEVKIAAYVAEVDEEPCKQAGADFVGMTELEDMIKANNFAFDVLVTKPENMVKLAKLGQKLGPRGLMPNPKNGTVDKDLSSAIQKFKKGQMMFRTDRSGLIHGVVGKINFQAENLKENVRAVLSELQKLKPASAKGQYLQQAYLSTSMGAAIQFDTNF